MVETRLEEKHIIADKGIDKCIFNAIESKTVFVGAKS
jgi:hypothetical protein